MKKPVLADTGPLYAAADPDDELYARSQRELKLLEGEGRKIVVIYPTLLEAYTLVVYRLGNSVAARWLHEITAGSALINPTPDDYRKAEDKLLRLFDQPITMFDATLAVMASRLNAEVWTFDHHFDILRAPVWR